VLTVFTSSHNHGQYLAEAIESVCRQTYRHASYEYLVYDDGSDDDTWDIIQRMASKYPRIQPIRVPKQRNVGVLINKSIRYARGDTWVWCPADDTLAPDFFEHKYQWAERYPNTVLYSHGNVMDADGKHLSSIEPSPCPPDEFRKRQKPIGMTGIWIPMAILNNIMFPEHLPFSEDFYWMLLACREGVDFRCVPKILYNKRKHGNSTTARNYPEIIANIDRIKAEVNAS
jgi:glycosyltransferase involved in cell wall biosynthesis